jgi:hypothetical protein
MIYLSLPSFWTGCKLTCHVVTEELWNKERDYCSKLSLRAAMRHRCLLKP